MKVKSNLVALGGKALVARTIVRSGSIAPIDLRKSASAATRKMVSYASSGRSRQKWRWRLEGVLTCKSVLRNLYSGERLIELSSSWFSPKFFPE